MHQNPIDSLRRLLQGKKADALLVTGEEDTFYLSRFPCTYGRVLITRKNAYFITDSRYKIDAEKNSFLNGNYSIRIITKGFNHLFQELCSAEKIRTCILESQKTTLHDFHELKEKIIGITFLPVENTVASLREFKTPDETLKITKALRTAELSFKQILNILKTWNHRTRYPDRIGIPFHEEWRRFGKL
jgi:Xaa-Pro aminopeptidase